MAYRYLPLRVVEHYIPLMRVMGVSEVARSKRGFIAAYRRAKGNPNRLSEHWRNKRDNFVKRHMAQVRKNREPMFRNGIPTRRHLALIAWAYSTRPDRL